MTLGSINFLKHFWLRIHIKISFLLTILIFASSLVSSQNIVHGRFPALANQEVKLRGFNGLTHFTIDSTQINEEGEFLIRFDKEDYGIGYLLSENEKFFIVIFAEKENLELYGENFELLESIKIINGKQNQFLAQYSKEHARRDQCLSVWNYLGEIYIRDTLFSDNKAILQAIEAETKRIKKEDSLFLESLPKDSYVSYYLPLRKLVSSASLIAQYRPEEIPTTIQAFRNLDYADPRLYKSGLLKDAIENHFWLIENSGRSLDSVYIEMQVSIDRMLDSLLEDEQKLNEITEHLFTFLEQRSLFTASEYLALRLLNQKSCTLDSDFASQLESYRAMKKGNIAPEIIFADDVLIPGYINAVKPKKLSDVNSNYKVVMFGASWCPQCQQDLPEISNYYKKWKQQDVEVVFVSLDEDKQAFFNFAQPFPFISTCDYNKWESPIAKDYHVFATPTIYLLNNEHEIILKPSSVGQLNAWIDWYLVQGNK